MDFIPEGYLKHNLLFANSKWVRELLETQSMPKEFIKHSSYEAEDVIAILRDGKVPKSDQNWEIISVDRFSRKSNDFVLPLPPPVHVRDENPCFAEVIEYVSQANFMNIRREAFKKFNNTLIGDANKKSKEDHSVEHYKVHHDSLLLEIICLLYNCPVIDLTEEIDAISIDDEVPTMKHCVSAIACIITQDEFVVLRPFERYSVHQMLRFSPHISEGSYLKPLFLVYQLLIAINDFHKKGISIGDLDLDDITIDDEFHLAIKPNLLCNLVDVKNAEMPQEIKSSKTTNFQDLLTNLKSTLSTKDDDSSISTICDNFLGNAVHLWATNQLSNFDYILLLNFLSGRTFSNPNHYPVMPWIRDFTTQNGGYRDLSKSKYRLNKGDTQLDLTFESSKITSNSHENDPLSQQKGAMHTPHHVSDVLSEITYYVYKARRTPKSILCKYVRNRWVPNEYPNSMQRLVEWTPDECIPEFFTDAEIFTSIHDDLPDLELPPWCQSPEDFINWHRQSLESPRVSERLHSWIDLTFGYKLSGSSAIRAKNVCLNLVDSHTDLRDGGVIQLFNSPHPTKVAQNPFWDVKQVPNFAAYR